MCKIFDLLHFLNFQWKKYCLLKILVFGFWFLNVMIIPIATLHHCNIFRKLQKQKCTNRIHVNHAVCETFYFLAVLLVLTFYAQVQIIDKLIKLGVHWPSLWKKEKITNARKFSIALSSFNTIYVHFWYIPLYEKSLRSNFNS